MTPSETIAPTVIGLESRRARNAPPREPKSLLETVYSAGSLLVRADDRPARMVAATLARFGFLVVDEICPDGEVRRLEPGVAGMAARGHPWRVSKPDLGAPGVVGRADAKLS